MIIQSKNEGFKEGSSKDEAEFQTLTATNSIGSRFIIW